MSSVSARTVLKLPPHEEAAQCSSRLKTAMAAAWDESGSWPAPPAASVRKRRDPIGCTDRNQTAEHGPTQTSRAGRLPSVRVQAPSFPLCNTQTCGPDATHVPAPSSMGDTKDLHLTRGRSAGQPGAGCASRLLKEPQPATACDNSRSAELTGKETRPVCNAPGFTTWGFTISHRQLCQQR